MWLVDILIIKLNQLNALVLLKGRELLELLSEKEVSELHRCFLPIVVETFAHLLLFLSILVDDLPLLWPETLGVAGGVTSTIHSVYGLVLISSIFLLSLLDKVVHSGLVKDTLSWSKQISADEPTHATQHVDVSSSCCVMKAYWCQPSISQDPRGSNRVNKSRHQHCENYVGVNKCSLSEGPWDNCRTGRA